MQQLLDEPLLVEDNGLPALDENEEDMALRSEDRVWIQEQIADAVREAKPHGIRRVMLWLKEWGAISAIWAVPLALLAVAITLGIVASNRISKEATFEQKTDDEYRKVDERLTNIQNTLSGIKTVSEVSSVLFDAQQKGKKIAPEVLGRLGESIKLTTLKNPDMDALWQTASTLISYRYANNGQDRPASSLPNCWDFYKGHIEDGKQPLSRPAPKNFPAVDEQTVGNCHLTLDDGPSYRNSGFGKAYERNLKDFPAMKLQITAHDVIVSYNGGKMIPFSFLECRNCVFKLNVSHVPPADGQRTVRRLLTADTSSVQIHGSQSGL